MTVIDYATGSRFAQWMPFYRCVPIMRLLREQLSSAILHPVHLLIEVLRRMVAVELTAPACRPSRKWNCSSYNNYPKLICITWCTCIDIFSWRTSRGKRQKETSHNDVIFVVKQSSKELSSSQRLPGLPVRCYVLRLPGFLAPWACVQHKVEELYIESRGQWLGTLCI